MKELFLSIALLTTVTVISCSQARAKIEIGGYIKTDNRVRLEGDNKFTWNENRLSIKVESRDWEGAHLHGEFLLRGFGFPRASQTSDLEQRGKVMPWALELREAYVDLYGLFLNGLDLRLGRQRIAWGTADKINPTDNLNPDDLEDPLDFGRKLGTNSLKATYYLGDYALTGVYIPEFTPAVLPPPDWAFSSDASLPLPAGMSLGETTDSVILPENRLRETSIIALKVAGNLFDYDFSLSYFNGGDDLPIATGVELSPVDSVTMNLHTTLEFPRMQVVGLDVAGTIADAGVWGEAGAFMPEKVKTTVVTPTEQGMAKQEMKALEDKIYCKYVLGGDYTFKNGVYVNGQYIHGFPLERGKDNLEDYLMIGLEKKFFNDELKIKLAGVVEIKDLKDIKNNLATVILPEINYYPVDNAEITVGSYFIDGKDVTTLGKMKKNDELYIKCKFSF